MFMSELHRGKHHAKQALFMLYKGHSCCKRKKKKISRLLLLLKPMCIVISLIILREIMN